MNFLPQFPFYFTWKTQENSLKVATHIVTSLCVNKKGETFKREREKNNIFTRYICVWMSEKSENPCGAVNYSKGESKKKFHSLHTILCLWIFHEKPSRSESNKCVLAMCVCVSRYINCLFSGFCCAKIELERMRWQFTEIKVKWRKLRHSIASFFESQKERERAFGIVRRRYQTLSTLLMCTLSASHHVPKHEVEQLSQLWDLPPLCSALTTLHAEQHAESMGLKHHHHHREWTLRGEERKNFHMYFYIYILCLLFNMLREEK